MDPDFGTLEGLYPCMGECSASFKTHKTNNPDTPLYHEAMVGLYRAEFKEAMINELLELESHKTWTLVKKQLGLTYQD